MRTERNIPNFFLKSFSSGNHKYFFVCFLLSIFSFSLTFVHQPHLYSYTFCWRSMPYQFDNNFAQTSYTTTRRARKKADGRRNNEIIAPWNSRYKVREDRRAHSGESFLLLYTYVLRKLVLCRFSLTMHMGRYIYMYNVRMGTSSPHRDVMMSIIVIFVVLCCCCLLLLVEKVVTRVFGEGFGIF